jgi:hypothetical protein
MDGVALTATVVTDPAFASADYVMSEALHIQGVTAMWDGMEVGDYAWVAAVHPPSIGTLGAQADAGQANVTVGAGLGVYYDPVNGAKYLEVWTAAGEIKEVRRILSRAGDVVTLESNLVGTYDATHVAKARYDGFSPVRGSHGIDGGARLVGAHGLDHRNEFAITAPVPVGMILSLRFKTGSVVGTRRLALNFYFRKLFAV